METTIGANAGLAYLWRHTAAAAESNSFFKPLSSKVMKNEGSLKGAVQGSVLRYGFCTERGDFDFRGLPLALE